MAKYSAAQLRGFHLTMMTVWAVLLIPTIMFWSQAILWLAIMSLYANFIGHFSAYQGARAEAKGED